MAGGIAEQVIVVGNIPAQRSTAQHGRACLSRGHRHAGGATPKVTGDARRMQTHTQQRRLKQPRAHLHSGNEGRVVQH